MIREFVNYNLVSCESSAKVFDVAKLMQSKNVGCVLVKENNKAIGVVTDRDITLRCVALGHDVKQMPVSSIVTKTVKFCHETDGLNDCIQKMKEAKVRRLPVLDAKQHPVGIISFGDIVSILSKELYDLSDRSHWKPSTEKKIA